MAKNWPQNGLKICKNLQYFAKNGRFFEEFCKIL
jgi:hypothetical protein